MAKDGKGRHASASSGVFYRDLAMMILGIILVGAAVFLLLFLIADNPDDTTTTLVAGESTSTSAANATTTSEISDSTSMPTPTSTSSTSTTIPLKDPSEVRVVVLNSLGIAGIAGRMSETLSAAGYQVLEADNIEPEQDPSRIWYRDGFSLEADILLEFLPGAVVEPLPDETIGEGADIVMVLGTGYEE